MLMKCQNKIWVENIIELFCSLNIIPLTGMTLEAQMNAITRLVIIVFLVLLLLGFQQSGLFIILSLLFIIIIYYVQRKKMEQKESYTPVGVSTYVKNSHNVGVHVGKKGRIIMDVPSTYRFCDDEVPLRYNNPSYVSANQKLAGPPNPKTHIAPVIAPPSSDLSYWKANNLVVHSAINSETQQEAYLSGFQVSTCCGELEDTYLVPQGGGGCPYAVPIEEAYEAYEEYESPRNDNNRPYMRENYTSENSVQENYNYPYLKTANNTPNKRIVVRPNESGEVNTACGYNPQQLYTAGLPTNLPAGNCEQNPAFKRYNENLFTQTLEPGVYTRNEVNQPINSNIGISFTQQLEPTTCKTTDEGLMFTEHDPRIIEPAIADPNLAVIEGVNMSNIYDPRHSGYGTSYRAYTDDLLGQTRFMYDDIDAIRMPNYITRSNIDFQPYADSYGPLPAGGAYGNEFNSKIRALANDTFTKSTIEQRTGLAQSLMRKRNAEMWQLRMFPINTSSQRMAGGMSCGAYSIA